jgi:hypothetical protein
MENLPHPCFSDFDVGKDRRNPSSMHSWACIGTPVIVTAALCANDASGAKEY